ncbi:MAG: hypothetical protein JKY67_22580 [Pseudomonadales bacterium]|nr:hypothetical protein [Pseudomonadales bacterium]
MRLLSELSCTEFDGLYHYYTENPFTEQLDIYSTGQICAAIYGAAGAEKVKPSDFYPKKRKPQTQAQQIAILRSL